MKKFRYVHYFDRTDQIKPFCVRDTQTDTIVGKYRRKYDAWELIRALEARDADRKRGG